MQDTDTTILTTILRFCRVRHILLLPRQEYGEDVAHLGMSLYRLREYLFSQNRYMSIMPCKGTANILQHKINLFILYSKSTKNNKGTTNSTN